MKDPNSHDKKRRLGLIQDQNIYHTKYILHHTVLRNECTCMQSNENSQIIIDAYRK